MVAKRGACDRLRAYSGTLNPRKDCTFLRRNDLSSFDGQYITPIAFLAARPVLYEVKLRFESNQKIANAFIRIASRFGYGSYEGEPSSRNAPERGNSRPKSDRGRNVR